MSESILLDTIALWGLIFANSKYHKPIVKTIRGKHIIIHSISFHELLYPAYKLESHGGKNIREGLELIENLMKAYNSIVGEHRVLFETEKLTIKPLTVNDLIKAYKLIIDEKEIFIEERRGYWPSVVDAVIASLWTELKIKLLTDDEKLIKYGKKHKLPYLKILK